MDHLPGFTLLFVHAPSPCPVYKVSKSPSKITINGRIFLLKQIEIWTTYHFHSEIKYTYERSTKEYIKSSEKQESANIAASIVSESR